MTPTPPIGLPRSDGSGVVVQGLSLAEVAERRQSGRVNRAPRSPSRTIGQILRANVLTSFNAVLGGIFVLVVLVAPPQDAAFGFVLVANSAIGVIQELRARRTLERLEVLAAPTATVLRNGTESVVAAEDVVADDVVVLRAGGAIVVDGPLLSADRLEIDASLLTGEADPELRVPGDDLRSGSVVVAGSGLMRAEGIGAESYAAQLTAHARRFSLAESELQRGISRILRWVAIAFVPAALLLIRGQARADLAWRAAAQRSAAGLIAMVPEGLVLLTSIAFAVGVVHLGRRHCLVKELPAVEILARVDMLCLDKTGTLTEGQIGFAGIEPLGDVPAEQARAALAALSLADPNPNASMAAIRVALADDGPRPGWSATAQVPFNSATKWSAATFAGQTSTWYLGAPEILLAVDQNSDPGHRAGRRAALEARAGRRVLLLASGTRPIDDVLPSALRPVALVLLEERVRSDAADAVSWFYRQGVTLKVISGDNPDTVAAVAHHVGIHDADVVVDGRDLPDDMAALSEVLRGANVFGRVNPDQKRRMVAALQADGHVVAMTGDGVNDVAALKDADLGIAMGTGSDAARAVARIVLLDSRFASLPAVVAEGQRVLANIERVANLFLTKTVLAFILAVSIGAAATPYPFLPRHLTLVSAVAIGLPGFVLALAPARQPARSGFVGRVAKFAGMSGTVIAAAVLTVYASSRAGGHSPEATQTVTTLTLVALCLVVLTIVMRPLSRLRVALVSAMTVLAVLALTLPAARSILELTGPSLNVTTIAVGVIAAATSLLFLGVRRGFLDLTRS